MNKDTVADLPLPKYYKLKQLLMTDIYRRRQKAGPGEECKLPSTPELIKKYKMSQITVRRALAELEKDGLIYKINGKGTFARSDRNGGGTAAGTSGNIGFFSFGNPTGEDTGDWHVDFTAHLRQVVYRNRYNLLNISPSTWESKNIKKFLAAKPVEGLILLCPAGADFGRILSREFPCVFMGEAPEPEKAVVISMDHAAGAALAMNQLLRNGHREIAILDVDDPANHANRIRRETGIRLLKEKAHRLSPVVRFASYGEEDGYRAMSQLLAERQAGTATFTAVFITEYRVGVGAVRAIKTAGLSVPDDISVVFCNGSSYLDYMELRITHAREPVKTWAEELVKNLMLLIKGRKPSRQKGLLKAELVAGDSVKSLNGLGEK